MFDIFSNWGFNSPADNKKQLGYYAQKQKELESNIGQVNVGPGKSINLDYNKKTGNIGEPHLGSGWGINTMQTKNTQNPNTTPFHPNQGGKNQNLADVKWWEKLGTMAGVDLNKASATWKDKGGFEGLMSNPAFTMGLAFMQAGAEGKTLGQGSLDNVMKAAGISSHYKKL